MPPRHKETRTGKGTPSPAFNNNVSAPVTPPGTDRTYRAGGPDISLGSIEGRVGYYIRRLQVWVFRDFIRTLSDLEIRPNQYSVLALISANPGLSQTDISNVLDVERSRLVRLLDGLEKRGLVLRLQAPNDRRSHALRLTAEGQALLARAELLVDEHEARLAARIGPKLYAMLRATMYEKAGPNSRLSAQ